MNKLRLLLSLFVIVILVGCGNTEPQKEEVTAPENNTEEMTEVQNSLENLTKDTMKQQKFIISTEFGDMTGVLYNETPFHRDNFIQLVKEGFYNDLLFHRVINEFMIQGGDPDSKNAPAGKMLGEGGPGYTIQAEFNRNLIHKKGALAAARMSDQMNPQRKSSGSQFYIVQGKKLNAMEMNRMAQYTGINYSQEQIDIYQSVGGTPFLDGQYTVFGEIVLGLDVIDKIATVQKDRNDRPNKDIKMTIKLVD